MNLAGQIAWVTGGGTGIGKALAKQLYTAGAKVLISGRRREVLDEAVHSITATNGSGEMSAIAGNASDPSHILLVVEEIKRRWGPIQLLINNAGANDNTLFEQATSEHYENALFNNCLSAIRITQAVLPDMLKARQGSIVNISSIYGRITSPTSASYCVSKHALTGYTDVLRQSVSKSGIHVLGVFPGFIETDMTKPFVRKGSIRSKFGTSPDDMAAAILESVRKKKRDLYFPWYVSWGLRVYRWMPQFADRLGERIRR